MADVQARDPATILLARLFASSTAELESLAPPMAPQPPPLRVVPPPSRQSLGVDPRRPTIDGDAGSPGILGGNKRIGESEDAEIEWWTQQGPARFQQLSDHIAALAELCTARARDAGPDSDEFFSAQDSLRRACSAWVKRVSPILAKDQRIAPHLGVRDDEITALHAQLTEVTNKRGGKSAKEDLEPFKGEGGSVGSLFKMKSGALWKIEGKAMVQPPRKEGLHQWGASSFTGIQPFGALLTNRAVASSRVDQILQTNVYARTQLKVIGGRVGQEMEKLTGEELHNIKGEEREELEQQDWFKAQQERLLLVNYITRQADPHQGNVMVNTEDRTVKEFDLDFSFGNEMTERQKMGAKLDRLNVVQSLSMPKTIDERLASIVLESATRQLIQGAIMKLLPSHEVVATLKRFDEVRAAVESGTIETVEVVAK